MVAINYEDPEEGPNHEGLIDEVVSHCKTSGVPYLLVDVRDTPKMSTAINSYLPGCGDRGYLIHLI